MQAENSNAGELSIQESKDHIQIGDAGVTLLYGIAFTALVVCSIAFGINTYFEKNVGSNGAIAGIVVACIIILTLYKNRVKLALIFILWGFALIPVFFGLRTFGFNAPGLICVPISIMAASWALSLRHSIAMTICACVACLFFFVLIRNQVIIPVEPDLKVRVIILIGIIVIALLLGLVGVKVLRIEFGRVRELAASLEIKVKELAQSEASFSTLFLSNPLPAISGGLDGKLIDVNHAFIAGFGYTREQLVHQTVTEIGLFEDERERRFIARKTLDKGVIGYPVMLRLMNGEVRNFLISTSTFELSNEWRFVALFLDQTDRLAAEKAQNVLNVELEQRVATRTSELSDALLSLKHTQSELVQSEKLASLGSMVAGIAHELNTPVGNALMVSSTLVDQQKQFETSLETGLSRSVLNHFLLSLRDSSDILDRNLRRTADLINSFKQVAVDQTSEQRRQFELHELVHEVIVTLSPSIRKTSHRLSNEVPDGIHMNSFPGPLEQVLMNLMMNALKHGFESRQNGQMCLRAEVIQNQWVRIRFADNGTGIPEHNLQKIFDPFFTTKLGQGGSGLGLSIAYNIVTGMLGGRIDVSSELGKGTEFCIEIPLNASDESQRSAEKEMFGLSN